MASSADAVAGKTAHNIKVAINVTNCFLIPFSSSSLCFHAKIEHNNEKNKFYCVISILFLLKERKVDCAVSAVLHKMRVCFKVILLSVLQHKQTVRGK